MLRIIGGALLVVTAAMAIMLMTPQEKTSFEAAVNAGPTYVLDWAQETASRRLGLGSADEPRGGRSNSLAASAQTARVEESPPVTAAATAQTPTSTSNSATPIPTHAFTPGPQVVGSVLGGGTGGGAPEPTNTDPELVDESGTEPSSESTPQAVVSAAVAVTPTPSPTTTMTTSNTVGGSATSTATPTATLSVTATSAPPPPPPAGTATPAPTPPPATVAVAGDSAVAAALLAAINEARAAEGLPALRATSTLGSIAASHASDMATQRRLSHNGSDGSSLGQRLNKVGAGFAIAGENVARGRGGAAGMPDVAQAFLASPVHRANLLNPAFQEVGLGVTQEADGSNWITVVFTD